MVELKLTDTSIFPHHLRVARTARYYTMGGGGDAVDEAWFALHGYRQAARRFARRFEVLDAPERIVVVPEARGPGQRDRGLRRPP